MRSRNPGDDEFNAGSDQAVMDAAIVDLWNASKVRKGAACLQHYHSLLQEPQGESWETRRNHHGLQERVSQYIYCRYSNVDSEFIVCFTIWTLRYIIASVYKMNPQLHHSLFIHEMCGQYPIPVHFQVIEELSHIYFWPMQYSQDTVFKVPPYPFLLDDPSGLRSPSVFHFLFET